MSDQDFFFDEDEKPAAKSQSKGAPPKKPTTPSGKSPSPPEYTPDRSVSYSIAALMAVAALLLGVIVGIVLPVNVGSQSPATNTGTSGTGASAPQLSPEQLQSGQLPPGHPNVGAAGSATATGSATTTP